MTTRNQSRSNILGLLGALALAAGCGACVQLHGEPQDGTETGNPPVASPTLNAARVALVISADQVRVTGQAGAASPAGATVEVISALTSEVFRGPVAADGSFDVSVSGSKLDTYEVRVVAEDEATSSSVYVAPGAAAVTSASEGGGLSCEQRSELAYQQLEAVASQSSKRCRIDSDCTTTNTNSACNANCSLRLAVSKVDAIEIDAARAAIEAGLCKTFAQDGCRLIVPPCPQAPGEVACIGGAVCGLVLADGSECAPRPVCVEGTPQLWSKVCYRELTGPAMARSELVCIADESGNVGLTFIDNNLAITNPGWSWSAYGQVPSTLSPLAQERCDAQLAALGVAFVNELGACLVGAPI